MLEPMVTAVEETGKNVKGAIAVVGDKKTMLPFKAFGVSTFEAKSPAEAEELLASITQFEVVFVMEELVEGKLPPNVTLIPGIKGNIGRGERILKDIIRRATGTEGEKRDG